MTQTGFRKSFLICNYTVTLLLCFYTGVHALPAVISTEPANGATNVSRDLKTVSIRFSKPMDPAYKSFSSLFPEYTMSWSENNTVINLTRKDLTTGLRPGFTYTFDLTPAGYESFHFRDTEGNLLARTTFYFTTKEYDYQLLLIEGNPARGFHWSYFLCIPDNMRTRTVLLVEPNNSGTVNDDMTFHETRALDRIRAGANFAIALDVPLLIPIFPRPADPDLIHIYTHALDENTLRTTAQIGDKSIARLDLQLIAMIEDAGERLADKGHTIARKIFMMGFSASGAFTSRFTVIHPDLIMAAAPGSPGGWPIAPVKTWGGIQYRYPIGISNIESITGHPFDPYTFRKVPQYIYVGDKDRNDALDTRGFPAADEKILCSLLNCDPNPFIAQRWPVASEIYASVDSIAELRIYQDITHMISGQMLSDIQAFFEQYDITRIDLSAIILILRTLSGLDTQEDLALPDISDDGMIGMEEAIYLLKKASGLM